MKGKLQDKKLEFTLKKLKLKKFRKQGKKFIALQLDGVSHDILLTAMEKGYMKFLKKLVEEEGYNLEKYNCGMPSGTPAIHSAIFYGDNKNIPSFRFIDKKNQRYFTFGKPTRARLAEKLFFANKKGILEGGASYANHLSGGAERSILTMSTITANKKFKRIKEGDLWLLLFLNPLGLGRFLYYSVAEEVLEIISYLWNLFTSWMSGKKGIYKVWMPFRKIMTAALLTEMITLGAILDVKRRVPKIYLTYLNYDDIGHFRGPSSRDAMFALRGLDRRVKRIYKQAKREGYDMYILSDHGQTPGVPFKQVHGMELANFIEKSTKTKSFGRDEGPIRYGLISVVMKKTAGVLGYLSTPLRWIVKAFAASTMKMLKGKNYPFDWDDKKSIFVVDSCSLAKVYFNYTVERAELKGINRKYPDLIEKLLRNKSIGIVMVKDGAKTVFLAKDGRFEIYEDGSFKTFGQNFLKRFGNTKILVKQLESYAKKNFLGDLILFGELNDGVMTSFTDHVGCHGSIGGAMMEPFFMSKEKYDMSRVIDAKALHKVFKRY